jgi:hypothetical protein
MADEPHASQPFMPGYGIRGPTQGTGLLPGTYRVSPTWVFGLLESDFEGSPARWEFA